MAEFLVLPNSCSVPGGTLGHGLYPNRLNLHLSPRGKGSICDAYCTVEETEAQRLRRTLFNLID